MKCHYFENCNFYKVFFYGERGKPPFSSSAIQNLIIIEIFKLMALRDTLVYDSDNSGPLINFGLLFPVVCFVFVSSQALQELSYP